MKPELKQYLSAYYKPIFSGLDALSKEGEKTASDLIEKLSQMEKIYFKSVNCYSQNEQIKITYYRKAFSYKFYIANLHVEQLWSINHSIDPPLTLLEILDNIFDDHNTLEKEMILLCFCFEGFIIQSTAFLEFYKLFICSILKIQDTSDLKGIKFIELLTEVTEEPFNAKAGALLDYASKNIYGPSIDGGFVTRDWGKKIKKIRDSLVHRDNLNPNFNKGISLRSKVLNNKNNDLNVTVTRFCQDVQNGMFSLITDMATIKYELEYIPGPYKEGMWD